MKLFEIKWFEIGGVGKLVAAESHLRQRACIAGQRGDAFDEDGVGMSYDCLGLV